MLISIHNCFKILQDSNSNVQLKNSTSEQTLLVVDGVVCEQAKVSFLVCGLRMEQREKLEEKDAKTDDEV